MLVVPPGGTLERSTIFTKVRRCAPAVNSEGASSVSDDLAFWDDLRRDLEDPDFAREYVEASVLIQTLDQLARDE